MQPALVKCNACGTPIDEPTDLDPSLRRPCPRCGSLTRRLERHVEDAVHMEDRISWTRSRRGREVHRGYVVALIVFVMVPPVVLALVGAALPAAVAVIVGIGLNLVGAYVGYRAVWLRVEIERG